MASGDTTVEPFTQSSSSAFDHNTTMFASTLQSLTDLSSQNDFLLFAVLCVCCVILVILTTLSICFCLHYPSFSEHKRKQLLREDKATSTIGLDQPVWSSQTNQTGGDFGSDFSGSKERFVQNQEELSYDSGDGFNAKRSPGENESSTLLSAQVEGMWTDSAVSRLNSISAMSSNYNMQLSELAQSGRQNSESSAEGVVPTSLPTDDNGHPRAWFVPLNEMCQERVRHSGIVIPSSTTTNTFLKDYDAAASEQIEIIPRKMKKSESSHAKLQSLPSRATSKLSKWAQREGRPVVFVPGSSDTVI